MTEERKIMLCYRRLSMVKNAGDLVSPEKQKKVVNSMVIDRFDLEPEWYEDIEGHSSGRTSDRDGWKKLMAQLDRPDIVGVAAYDLSRLYRNVTDFLDLVKKINDKNLRLLMVNENVDTKTAIGMAILTIFMAMYQLESDLASERMKSNIKYKRETMGRHWGPVPYGCTRNEEKDLIPDPKTHDSLLYLFEMFSTGNYTYDELVMMLNEGHHPWYTRKGDTRLWQKHDVQRVLQNWKLYSGLLPIGRQKDHPEIVVNGSHAPILPVDLCEKVGRQLEQRRHRISQGDRQIYLLTPLTYCGVCGGEIDGNTREEGIRFYKHALSKGHRCPERRVRADILEGEIIPLLSSLAESPDLQRAMYEEVVALRAMSDPKAKEIQTKIQETITQRNRLVDLLLSEDITKEEYHTRREAVERKLVELQESLPAAAADEFEEAMWAALDMLRDLEELEPKQQKEIIHTMLERIEVRDRHVSRIIPKPWARPFF